MNRLGSAIATAAEADWTLLGLRATRQTMNPPHATSAIAARWASAGIASGNVPLGAPMAARRRRAPRQARSAGMPRTARQRMDPVAPAPESSTNSVSTPFSVPCR